MTPRERLLAVLHGEIPDRVPCEPDISNMIPARLTGKPFWDIYIYQDPPLWKAYLDAVKYFGIDGGMENYTFMGDVFNGNQEPTHAKQIVHRYEDGSFVTQTQHLETGTWSKHVEVNTADNPPASGVLPEKLGLSAIPTKWEEITGVKEWPKGEELWRLIFRETGDAGVVGLNCGCTTNMLGSPEGVFSYYDNPSAWHERTDRLMQHVENRMAFIAKLDPLPDFLMCGGSGSLVFQTPAIFESLCLPVLKYATELAATLGIPTHVHSCGPEKELVRMAAEHTQLTVIDPLEPPPMGDCDLAELKRLYGDRIVLKGNLHTTEVMLHGSVGDVKAASRKAIDDAAQGGKFILSTGDQCGRDTPDENIRAMLETADTYGRY